MSEPKPLSIVVTADGDLTATITADGVDVEPNLDVDIERVDEETPDDAA